MKKSLLTVCLLILVLGCDRARKRSQAGDGNQAGPLILRPAISTAATADQISFLKEQFANAEEVPFESLNTLLASDRSSFPPLVIPSPSLFPREGMDALRRYAREGGGVLLWGTRPFQDEVVLLESGPLTRDAMTQRLIKAGQVHEGMPDVELWRHENDTGRVQGSVQRSKGESPWPGVYVTMSQLNEWDALLVEDIPLPFPEAWDTILLYASGANRSARLVVQVEESDNSVWVADLGLDKTWKPYALHERDFRYTSGGLERGVRDDQLDLTRIVSLRIGLDMHHAPQHPGRHEFGVSEVRFTAYPLAPQQEPGEAGRLPFAQPALRFSTTAQTFEEELSGRLHTGNPVSFESIIPGPNGFGGEVSEPFRWIPVVRAVSGNDELQAWPVSMFWTREPEAGMGRWGWVSMDLSTESRKLVAPMLRAALERLYQPVALAGVVGPPLSVRPDSFLTATATCRLFGRVASDIRVTAEVYKEDDLMTHRSLSPNVIRMAGSNDVVEVPLRLGVMLFKPDEENRYRIRIALEDTLNDHVFDEVVQPVHILPEIRTPPAIEPIKVSASQLAIINLNQFLLGVAYQPMGIQTWDEEGRPRHWLDHGAFDALAVRRDLNRLFELGVNTLVVDVQTESQAPQLNYFLEEAARHAFWIVLHVEALNPLAPRLEEAHRILQAIDVNHRPEILALEVMRDAELGPYRLRTALDYAWGRWLEEQYGPPEQFEKVMGAPLWSILESPTGPTDFELSHEGDHAPAVTAYRRFVQDHVSRRLGMVKRYLREQGIETYVAVRGGYSGNSLTVAQGRLPVDLAAAGVHADILMPSGQGLYGALDRFYESAFLTAYARGVSGGKPVVWAGMGVPAPAEMVPEYLENQDRIFLNHFLLSTLSHSSGLLMSTFAERPPLAPGVDAGIVQADGSMRPAGMAFREFGHRLRKIRPVSREWKGRETELPAQARGFMALWDAWHQVYHKELRDGSMEEIRPFGFSYTTKNMPLVSVGGRDFHAPAPLVCVNAEWGTVSVDNRSVPRKPGESVKAPVRKPVSLELINTGPSTWEASRPSMDRTVWVEATHAERQSALLKVPEVKFGDRAEVTWVPSDPGVWRLRALVKGVGEFGETLLVEVE